MISTLNLNAQAGPAIPEPDPENGWHWDIDVGTEIYFESEFIITNYTTGEVSGMWRDIWIYNITSIENVTIDWLGVHEFSQVNATQYYYNVTADELEPYHSDSQEFALFGHNSTDPITHRIRAGTMGLPLLLPKNSSSLEIDILAPIINESFYTPMGMSGFNVFDNYNYDVGLNRIYFWNSTPGLGYFSEGIYYENGTLDYGEASLLVNMGDGPIVIDAVMKQVPNYDIIDEITWGVSPGQDIYYDWYEGSDPAGEAYDVKAHINSISPVLLNKTMNSFSDEDDDPVHMVYQRVFGDIYVWNGTDYDLEEVDVPLGTANNFYNQYFDDEGPDLFNFIYPNNFALEDFEFMWNNDTLRIWNAPFDEIYYSENGVFESLVVNSTGTDVVRSQVDKTTGIVQNYLMTQGSSILYYEIQVQTLVSWSVGIDDVIYYKNNEEEFRDIKVTIAGTASYYANISDMLSFMGIPMPSGQPDLQFYSVLLAELEVWDDMTETWVYDDFNAIAVSNIYWPISPLQFQFGPPLIMPENTAASDLSDLFDVYGAIYDDITYTTGHVSMRNTTLDREMHFYFDETSGRVEMMYGWMSQPFGPIEWNYMSIYPKFVEALPVGVNTVTLNTDFPNGVTIDMEANVTGVGAEFIYNYFTMNPTNVTLPNGTASNYFDLLIVNRTLVSGNITMTIHIPTSIDLTRVIFFFYAFNMSGTNEWDSPPPDFYANQVTYNFVLNTITINMEPWDRPVVSCMAFVDLDADPPVEIPGYNILFLSLMILVVSGLVVRKVRKK
jgi:hypothetical protein